MTTPSTRRCRVVLGLIACVALLAPWRSLVGDEPPAKQEPPVRLKKKPRARPAEESPAKKPEEKPKEPPRKPPELPKLKEPDEGPDQPPEPGADPRELLNRATKNMRDAEQRLGKRDSGTGTQQKQRDVVTDLDKLIEQQQQQQQQQASSSSQQRMRRRQQDQRSSRQQQQQPLPEPQDQSGQSAANRAGGGGRGHGSSKIADLYKDIWGHLPETMRQEMDAYSREQFMAKYNDLLKQYYSTLAEKGRRAADQ